MASIKKSVMLFVGLATAIICSANLSVQACGVNSDCRIAGRHYRIRMPASHDGSALIGAIVYAHGYRGTAQQVMRNKQLIKLTERLGIALIAPKSAGIDWTIPGAPQHSTIDGADELVYFDRLIYDVVRRFPIDKDRLMAVGFSAGGMMIWNLACHRSHLFAGFAPIAGTFWRPIPERCTTPPASIIHMHGTSDRVVPIEGRRIANTAQGSVIRAIEMYGRYGEFETANSLTAGDLTCQRRVNPEGRLLEFCKFPGGHTFDASYIARAWRLIVMRQQN